MADKFINKSAINVNHATNATGMLSAIGAITAAYDGITQGRPIGVWLPMMAMGLSGAIAQWLQGEPTPTTKLIAKVLQLDGTRTNAELIRDGISRIVNSGGVPGLGDSGAADRVGEYGGRSRSGDALNAETLERMAADGDYGNCQPVPNPDARVTQYWRNRPHDRPVVGAPTIEGTNITPMEFAARSMGDEQGYSVPLSSIEGGGEWPN